MPNEQEKLAREWAEKVKSVPEINYGPEANAAAEIVLATTAPPSMADVEWDDEKHYLAGATTPRGNDVVMMWHDGEYPGSIITGSAEWAPKDLTPNGKKYELREVATEHPRVLCTVEDYENAPEGTVVAQQGSAAVWVKSRGEWRRGDYDTRPSELMEKLARAMLREGWGA